MWERGELTGQCLHAPATSIPFFPSVPAVFQSFQL
jgi:hypothetical protein